MFYFSQDLLAYLNGEKGIYLFFCLFPLGDLYFISFKLYDIYYVVKFCVFP